MDECVCPQCGNVNPEQILEIIEARAVDGMGRYTRDRRVSPDQWHGLFKQQPSAVEVRGLYSATKAALIGMARAHALELGPYGITVNCLAPGPVATDLPMNLLNDEQKRRFAERTALKRWGQTIDMVGPALLLASDAGAYITGTVILADGGMLCRTFD